MDPASMAIIAKALEPFFGLLALAAIPTGILWVIKSHKVRMRELDLEAQHLPRSADARLHAIEARLSSIEQALHATPPQNPIEGRAALLEGPATGESAAAPPAVHVKER
jgi:hypothetical protein